MSKILRCKRVCGGDVVLGEMVLADAPRTGLHRILGNAGFDGKEGKKAIQILGDFHDNKT